MVGNIAGRADRGSAFADDPLGFVFSKISIEVGQHDWAIARPMPFAAPVTNATWPLKSQTGFM